MSTALPIVATCCVLASLAHAQKQELRDFQRQTAPVRDAGVYHLATGTWTRPGASAGATSLTGGTIDTVYACTAFSNYFATLDPGQVFTASGRIPSPTSPNNFWNSAAVPDGSVYGSASGCAASYTIDGFRISYCTDQNGPNVVMTLAFFQSWNPVCTSSLSAATPQGGPFAVGALPGRGATPLACWAITIDLAATTASFSMAADGNGAYNAGVDDGFGWSFSFPSVTSTTARTGPLIAGSPSAAFSPGNGCQPAHPGVGWLGAPGENAGYDGRVFDIQSGACAPLFPANGSSFNYPPMQTTTIEGGSDMLGDDGYRIEGGVTPPPGCYFFGGPVSSPGVDGPYANFFLELYAKVNCTSATIPEYCAGDGLGSPPTTPCPCANVGAPGNGCASSFNPAGAHITATGSIAFDTVVLHGSGMQSSGVCVFLKGNAVDPNAFQFGDGITCTGGSLVRLRGVALSGGNASFPVPPETITLSARGGNTPGSGQLASYTVFYRNAAAAFCPPFTFNAANNVLVVW